MRTIRIDRVWLASALALLAGCKSVGHGGWSAFHAAHVPHELLVRFRDGTDPSTRGAVLTAAKGVLVRTPQPLLPDLYLVRVGGDIEAVSRDLERQPEVLYAHPNYYLAGAADTLPTDKNFPFQWGLWTLWEERDPSGIAVDAVYIPGVDSTFLPVSEAGIDAAIGWDTHTGTGDFVIAVIDSGLAVGALDFTGNKWEHPGGVGWDFVLDDPVTFDTNGHGTRIASIIGARANDSEADSVVGVNWACKIMPLRIIGSDTDDTATEREVLTDVATLDHAIAAIRFSADMGAKVSNNSYGARGIGYAKALAEAIEYAGTKGQLFVTCAGNFGTNYDLPSAEADRFYPAAFKLSADPEIDVDNMLVVTSTDPMAELMPDVGYGTSVVDIAAPGSEIYAINQLGYYGFASHGTSYATAFVSGAVALVWDLHGDWDYKAVKEHILAAARVANALLDKVDGGRVLNVASLLLEE